MVNYIVRQQGVPAFAFPSSVSDLSSSWPCSLSLQHDELDAYTMRFSALVAATVTIYGFGEHKVALALYGDNMMPGRNSLGAPKIVIPHDCLAVISRDGTSIPQTLSLTLKEPCSLRYPRSLAGSVAEFSTPCRQLVTLANTTNIDILFDSQWLIRGFAQLYSALRYPS
jgi:hypothetical protein